MKTYASCLAVLLVLMSVGTERAAGVLVGPVIAETGFNDATGINSDGVANSPYELDSPLVGQPATGEVGWAGGWIQGDATTSAPVVQSTVTFEGDGAARFRPVSNTERQWTNPQDGQFVVESRMRFSADSRTAVYIFGSDFPPFDPSFTATMWHATPDGGISVLDGVGDGSKPFYDTGFAWVPDQWYKFTQFINYQNASWRFFMDDVEYVAPDTLGFRGTPPPLDGINILSQDSPGSGAYLDDLRIMAIPEPSTLILAAFGLLGLLLFHRRK